MKAHFGTVHDQETAPAGMRAELPHILLSLAVMLLMVLVVFLFNYLPIYGVLIAFQDFMPGDKILSSETIWVGFENFTRFFNDVQFWPLMKNTFLICIIGFVIGFPLPIIVSLSLNALKHKRAGKVLQTIYTAPHFISLVVLVGMLQLFFGRYGLVNNLAASLGVLSAAPEIWAQLGCQWEDVRPDAMVLCYPVITGGPYAHRGSFDALTGTEDQTLHTQYSLETLVTPQTPPAFLWHTWEDGLVPVQNSLLFASALAENGVLAEVHLWPRGGHGLSLANDQTSGPEASSYLIVPEVQPWIDLACRFLRAEMKGE